MTSKKMSGADILVKTLEAVGADTAFGIPGVHNLRIYQSLLNSSIKHVTVRNESGAGFMADGYARASGKPGLAIVITGPGLTNILTPMGQAFQDSVPMVVVSSQLPTRILNQSTGFLHELKNSTIMAKSVAKESRTVPSIEFVESYIRDAYKLSVSGRPGPVHVEIPLDILAEKTDDAFEPFAGETRPTDVKMENIQPAADEINSFKSIAIIAGGGASDASAQVIKLAEKLNAGVVLTAAGKGVVPDRHPLCIGTRLPFKNVREFLEKQDAVIAIGTQLAPTDLWETELDLNGKLIQIDRDQDAFYRHPKADRGLQGDAGLVLNALMPLLDEKSGTGSDKIDEMIQTTVEMGPAVTGNTATYWIGIQVLNAIRDALGEEGILAADMTTAAYIGLSEYEAFKPRTFLHPAGFGTLGYSVPAAIGAKISLPERKIAALIGDGGFQFTMQELAVACEQNLPLPIILWNNDGYGEIKRNEAAMGFSDFIAVANKNPDFVKLAEAYGIDGVRPENSQDLRTAIECAFEKSQPTLIEVHINHWTE